MRVLQFCNHFSPLSETFIYDKINELERQGCDNHVVTLLRKNEASRPFPKVHALTALKLDRWDVRRLWGRTYGRWVQKKPFDVIDYWPTYREQLKQRIRTIQPEVIHAHFGSAAALIAPVASRLQIPLVVTFYGYDISSLPNEPFWADAYRKLWPDVEAATVLSDEMKVLARELGCPDDKLRVIRLSRNLDEFLYRPPRGPVQSFLFVGRLVPKKAPMDAVRAIERANEQGPGEELSLDVIGDGPLRDEMERYIKEQGLSHCITLHGERPNQEVAQRLKAADAFLLPSRTAPDGNQEGTPTVLVEAQAIGLPCVSTRHAGIPEMIPARNHEFLVAEGDIEGLANALRRLASQSKEELLQLSIRGREMVEREFSLAHEAEKLRSLYGECGSIRPGSGGPGGLRRNRVQGMAKRKQPAVRSM